MEKVMLEGKAFGNKESDMTPKNSTPPKPAPPPEAPTAVFVYGSLRRGFPWPPAAKLAATAQWLGSCRIPGGIYPVGELQKGLWYPGWLPDGPGTTLGDIYLLPADSDILSYLDAYEGISTPPAPTDEYTRITHFLPEKALWVWIYQWNPPAAPDTEKWATWPNGDYTQALLRPKE